MNIPETEFEQLTRPGEAALRFIVGLHWIESAAQLAALAVFLFVVRLEIPYGPLTAVVIGFVGWNGVSLWLLRREITQPELQVLIQLLVEVLVLAALLYFTGGATNPFVSLFLVPLAIGAITLRFALAVLVALTCVVFYTLLLVFHDALAIQHMAHQQAFSIHVIGMWINFLISASVSLVALSWLAGLARSRAQRIAGLREQVLRQGQLSALGGIAAAAAHSISTPLSTVAILLDDLQESLMPDDPRAGKMTLARDQLTLSRERLTGILRNASADRVEAARSVQASIFVERVVMQWRLLRPEMHVDLALAATAEISIDPTIEYTLTTLMDNAADANAGQGAQDISVRTTETGEQVIIEVEDAGGGPIPDPALPSSKRHGAGAGLMIARANIERLGGELAFRMGSRGCIACLRLPRLIAGGKAT